MFSNHKTTNRTLALFTFLASLILYFITMAPTASFWDAGEFIAVGHGLQVNHPPGAPFYSLLGRIFSMFMPTAYVAASINFISVLSSALTVMLLYLIIVKLVREWKGLTDQMPTIDQIGMYGGAVLGALTFAVTDTFWFSAVEAEVYAVSMLFTALVVWLALVWAENHEEPYNERWLILIAYLFGIALGIHLLNLLALFFVALIIYFKKYEFSYGSFGALMGVSTAAFLLIYPGTIQGFPSLMEWIINASYGLIGPIGFIIFVGLVFSWGLYYTHQKGYRLANIVILCYAMIMIGYSSYSLIFIRSIADPPIDENDPETVEAFIKYLEREQYGQTPLLTGNTYDNSIGNIDRDSETFFPRRYSTNPQHIQQYSQYSSDLDYFLSYQVNHMYWRYFAWNFIGRDADIQDAGWQSGFTETEHEDNPAHNSYFYIPFLLGLFGFLYHFQNDWKRALSVLALFVFTGLAIIFYLNQTPMQPRERDYAYVGSFFAFAIWIGMGGVGLVELVKDYLNSNKIAAYGLIGALLFASPVWMGMENFHDHDRGDRYVAPDYAYNLLNSAAPNAILFTNGDNDTFPLWYLQEVEGIRTDVRIVCLSLLNTEWYIKQLRDQWSHESAPLPISLDDDEVQELTSGLSMHNPDTLRIPVDKEMLSDAFSNMDNYMQAMGVDSDKNIEFDLNEIGFQIPIDSLDNEVAWYYEGRSAGQDQQGNQRNYTQVQDEVILDIIRSNNWVRPVYFANTVSNQSQMNLQPYFRFEGKAFRVVPQKRDAQGYGWMDPEIHAKRLKNFQFREWNNPNVYFDENIRRMLGNYRFSITELANEYKRMGEPDSASYWLEWGEEKLPFKINDNNLNSIILYAYSYADVGSTDNGAALAQKAEGQIMKNLQRSIDEYDELEARISRLNQEAEEAKNSANRDKQQQLQQQIEGIGSERQQIAQDISMAVSHLTIVQRIYFMNGDDDQALELHDRVNDVTGSRISVPESKEENKKEVDQFQL
ncbi:MAG: glycosyltransferase family 117 protein [Bacteroidota bacterium]